MSKILLVYPNREGYPIIPLGISLLSGILKHAGHETDLFDITFMMRKRLDHTAREETGFTQPVDVDAYWGTGEECNITDKLRDKIRLFNPDIVAFSIVENNYGCARDLFKVVKEMKTVLIIVGGVFPTVAPEFFIEDKNVDLICLGEGEFCISEVADRLDRHIDLSNIPYLIAKTPDNNKIIRSGTYYKWDPLVVQDWTIFDPRHIMKPFMGKMRNTGFFEFSRGCPYNCSYCNNYIMQKMFRACGNYNREKQIGSLIDEISLKKKQYNLELIFFNDENFLQMNDERFSSFCQEYGRIGLPFFIQTRADTLLVESRVAMLQEAGCVTIGIGVEHGNESIRRGLLNKKIPNWVFRKAFENCNKRGMRTTANIMIGLPFETEENILETVDFCRIIQPTSVALSIFAPYYGTELRRTCVDNGFMENRYYDDISVNYRSILTMPQLSKAKIEELYYGLHDLIFAL